MATFPDFRHSSVSLSSELQLTLTRDPSNNRGNSLCVSLAKMLALLSVWMQISGILEKLAAIILGNLRVTLKKKRMNKIL